MIPYISKKVQKIFGTAVIPGDKSISHRSIMFASLAVGKTEITGLLEGEDVLATVSAFKQMGADIERVAEGHWTVYGVGLGGLHQPEDIIDMGNSGTSTRLIMGIIAGHPIKAIMTGDDSLRKRPMGRVINPLNEMGAEFDSNDGKLPLTVFGTDMIMPIKYVLPMPSAQVKSAILLAGLTSRGNTTVIETEPTRDHTENMLRHFGATVDVIDKDSKDVAENKSENTPENKENTSGENNTFERHITVYGQPVLKAKDIVVPSDPSSASFVVAAACIVPDSKVHISAVCMNPTRTGFFTTLQEMGANITISNERTEGGEPLADLDVTYAPLQGIDVPADRAASMIDEYPILSVVASFAHGKTHMAGVGELRVKESDRLQAVIDGLHNNGVKTENGDDWMTVFGSETVQGGGTVTTHLDHRLAMSFLIMGLASENPVCIDDITPVQTSFPTFEPLMAQLGADFTVK